MPPLVLGVDQIQDAVSTLSGAIDVIVVEQDDGSLACSPFHVRFGKFSLLRPYEKKVEFKVNDVKQQYPMKLGEGGEAFFVFETFEDVPESQQTSPIVSPVASPPDLVFQHPSNASNLQEPEFLDLNLSTDQTGDADSTKLPLEASFVEGAIPETELNHVIAGPTFGQSMALINAHPIVKRSASEEIMQSPSRVVDPSLPSLQAGVTRDGMTIDIASNLGRSIPVERSHSPPILSPAEALQRAHSLSDKLLASGIPALINEVGDLMLDMTAYKSREEDALRAELFARKVLAQELEGDYDLGALIGADESGNIWIYHSEDAKNQALAHAASNMVSTLPGNEDATSDPGIRHEEPVPASAGLGDATLAQRKRSDSGSSGLTTPPDTPQYGIEDKESMKTFAKTLRLTSDQLTALQLKNGPNSISFSVNRATCHAVMYFWKDNAPIVISDIDGTITKSDALGHVLNMIGRDWTHLGVAKLYTDIVANGYHILYLTSRSVGQADTTRAYLNGVTQEGFKLPKGPVILSPDRTMVALRREIYLRQPEVFKMSCLRDIRKLFSPERSPFYAGFGNRLTDALSYRTVNIPSTRIFTINTDAEVSLDLLSLNRYKSSYVTMREIVDHFFPPTGLLVSVGGEEFTDFNYWRDAPADVEDYLSSDDETRSQGDLSDREKGSIRSEDEGSFESEGDQNDDLGESFLSYESHQEPALSLGTTFSNPRSPTTKDSQLDELNVLKLDSK